MFRLPVSVHAPAMNGAITATNSSRLTAYDALAVGNSVKPRLNPARGTSYLPWLLGVGASIVTVAVAVLVMRVS
jgi:hypothetical protein